MKNKQLSQGIFPEAEPEAALWLHVFYKERAVQEKAIREWEKQGTEVERLEKRCGLRAGLP